MPRIPDWSLERRGVHVRVSTEAYDALKEVALQKGGTVTSRAQEILEAAKHIKPGAWHRALAALERAAE